MIRDDQVDDPILTMPAVRAIRRAYPHAELTLLVSPYNAPVVRDWRVPDRIELYDRAWPIGRRITAARTLRARRYDLCVVLHPNLETFIVARWTGAPVRAGRVGARVVIDRLLAPFLLTDRYVSRIERAASRHEPVEHEVTATRRVLERVGIGWAGDDLELPRDPAAETWAEAVLAGAGIAVDFARLAALIARCDAVVTRDTGSLHVAAAMGRPVAAIYAPGRFEINRQQFAP